MNNTETIEHIKHYLTQLQHTICQQLSAIDGKNCVIDDWTSELGTGSSRIFSGGKVFEKGGVSFSHVSGLKMPASATAKRPELTQLPFQALGVSLVLHPHNPFVPTCHMNIRFFMAKQTNKKPVWWFGGGYDLTPFYAFEEDCIHWHSLAKKTCDTYDSTLYDELRQWCNRYFYLKHRNEPRGIGGLFFDDFQRWEFDKCQSFWQAVGDSFIPAYIPIVEKRKAYHFSERQKTFQEIRRGRYVEFNLLHDRGTLFGLQTGGRTESILMSLPQKVQWHYNWQPEAGSKEAELTEYFLTKTDWL